MDNAAKIFPVISNQVRTMVFRLSVELKARVKIKELQLALSETLLEYPYFRSQLKKGFFWYWLEPSDTIPLVQFDEGPPCRAFKMKHRNHLLIRVLAKNNMVSVEFMHVLCDGAGGMQFILSLIRKYGELCGWDIDPEHHPINKDQASQEELLEDSYKRYFNKHINKPSGLSRAYHLPLKLEKNPILKILSIEISTSALLVVSKKYQVSLTVYLASIYLYVLQSFYLKGTSKRRKRKDSILRIEIPVNLRNIFPSKTLRNFALFVMPEIDPKLGEYSFKEIVKVVHHYMQLETDRRQIMRIIRRNVGGEKNLMVRAIPLFLKVPVLLMAFKAYGPKLYSGMLTNVGKANISEECSTHIDRLRIYPPPPDPTLKVSSALISYGDKLVLSFGNQTKSMKFEQEVIRFLQNEGLNLKILNP